MCSGATPGCLVQLGSEPKVGAGGPGKPLGVERESIPPFQVRVCYNRMVRIARDALP